MNDNNYDIVFAGHTYIDEIRVAGRAPVRRPGGALMYGAIAAARVGCRVAVIAKLDPRDRGLLGDLEAAGIRCILAPATVTSVFEVTYPVEGSERRSIRQVEKAEPFTAEDLPLLGSRYLVLAGNAAGEFAPGLYDAVRQPGRRVALDMQAFVRQAEAPRREIAYRDVPAKREIAASVDVLKLDAQEAEVLTGQTDTAAALAELSAWGCGEVVMTRHDGVAVRYDGRTLFCPYTNRSAVGRNGRGDTTFAAYLARRLTHEPAEALEFAATLAALKLEREGPFAGTRDDVLARMRGQGVPGVVTLG